MESSQFFGASAEEEDECHSTESGWTMYLGSSIHGDDDDDQHSYSNGGNGGRNGKYYCQEDDDSDDSMASDASSGPSHQDTAHLKRDDDRNEYDDDGDGKYCSESKVNKIMEKPKKLGDGRKKLAEVGLMGSKGNNNANSNTSPTQSGSKVRKSSWLGKRK
ncbi:protein SOB FIVE-LIKE 1 [Mercurialis annua]|uniref:protein SOB FIVE-LIKE 1 n=1 Tax=Mercurialis annua TaxID=3986 RepID=UPI0021607683|nr:protein SOB FIVE-LIKE 1 [Mercurialis annua]